MHPASATTSCRLPRRRVAGSVLLLVLVTVLLAAFLLTKFVARAGTELLADARASEQARLRREAYSSLEATLAVLADLRAIDSGLHSPAQGWGRALEVAGYTPGDGRKVDVIIEDESGKVSLPTADAATLKSLLVLLGLDRAAAEQVSDALLVWTREDHVPGSLEADGSNYERAAIPYRPAWRPLRSFGELAAVETVKEYFFDETGRPTSLAQEFQANVSLYAFAQINLNTASPVVLAAGGLGVEQIDALAGQARRQRTAGRADYFRATSDVTAILGANAPLERFGVEASALRITVTVRGGAVVYRLSAVVAPPGGANLAEAPPRASPAPAESPQVSTTVTFKKLDYPFRVLEIRENLESNDAPPTDSLPHD